MSIKQDRTGTRTSEDLRRRINVKNIDDAVEKVDASVEMVQALNNQVTGLNNTLTNTRETYVSTNNQTFTEEQKTRSRTNIGAGTSSFSGSYNDLTNKPSIPTKTSDLTNDSNFVSDSAYVHTDNNYTTTEKTKLSGIENGAKVNVIESISVNGTTQTITNKNVNLTITNPTVDTTMSDTSTNAVQNKVIKAYVDSHQGSSVYQYVHNDSNGYIWFDDGFLIQWGRAAVTPSVVNTDTTLRVNYTYAYDDVPDIHLTQLSSTPKTANVTGGGGTTVALSKQGLNIYVNSSTTRAVNVNWEAKGHKAIS